MGLDGTTSHAIWAIVVLSVLGGLAITAFEQVEALDEARRNAEDLRAGRVLTRFGAATFCWDEPALKARFTTLNLGQTTLDLAELRIVVDGVPLPVATAYPGEVWTPGETRTLLADAPVEPDRALLVTSGGDLVYADKVTCPVLTTIVVTPASATMDVGDAQDFVATGFDQFGDPYPGQPYSFSTAAGSVTVLDPSTGRLTAGTTAGTFLVTATSGAVSGTATVTIKPGAPASVAVSPGVAGVPAGGTATFSATVHDQWGNVNATSPVSWSTNAGSVTQGGVLTAQTTAQDGRAVTATTTGGVSGSATVDVMADAPVSIDLAPDDVDVTAGATQAFTLTLLDQYGNLNDTAPVLWTTDAGSVTQGGVLTAQTATATGLDVTATSGALTASAVVDVIPDEPATIVVSPSVAGVTAGGTQAFAATVYDQYGNVNASAPVAWSTSAGSVTSGGVLTAQTTAASGLSVTATSQSASQSAVVDVIADAPATVTVTPSPADVTAGAQRTFTATARDQHGNVNATAPISWSTDAGSVSGAGVLTAQTTAADGRSVTATTTGAVSGSATVNVVPDQPASVTVTPGAAGVPAGGTASFSAVVHDQYGNVNATAAVTWSTTAGSISGGGLLTAQTTPALGRSVTATSLSASRSVTVDVYPAAPASITITPNPTTVTAGGTRTFGATVYDSFGNVNSTAPVSWSTNAGSITSGGVLTAQTTAASGRTVSATSGAVTQSATVDVLPGPVDTITVSPSTATVYLNRTQQFTATMRDAYGNVNTTATLSWSATSGSITAGGLYTAPATSGGVTVTASANGKTGTASVTVTREAHVDAMATYRTAPASSFRKLQDTVEVRVTVKDHEGVVVAGASVTVQYVDSGGAVAATRTGTTNASGIASVTYDLPNSAPQGAWTARVTGITGSGMTYASSANVVTQVGFTVTV